MKKRILIATLMICLMMIPSVAFGVTYSRAKTRTIVGQAASYYHLSKSATNWLKNAAIDIIYTGRHESGGSTSAGKGHSCVGILQFDSGWRLSASLKRMKKHLHIHGDWRLSGTMSLYRFVKSYKDGGKAAIHRHWKATLGR